MDLHFPWFKQSSHRLWKTKIHYKSSRYLGDWRKRELVCLQGFLGSKCLLLLNFFILKLFLFMLTLFYPIRNKVFPIIFIPKDTPWLLNSSPLTFLLLHLSFPMPSQIHISSLHVQPPKLVLRPPYNIQTQYGAQQNKTYLQVTGSTFLWSQLHLVLAISPIYIITIFVC